MKTPNQKLFYAINHPKYFAAITNEGKATNEDTHLHKKLTISDIKKWKKEHTYKLAAYEFSRSKWSVFSFKYEGIKGKEILGKSKYLFNNSMYLGKNGISIGSDISEVYIYNNKIGKPLNTKTLLKRGILKRKKTNSTRKH